MSATIQIPATLATLVPADEPEYTGAVATTIKKQIGVGPWVSLGAHEPTHAMHITHDGLELSALTFKANILPFLDDGNRSTQPRTMRVAVVLNALDYYDVTVSYETCDGTTVVHYHGTDIDCFTLGPLMLALDFDGKQVLNPRYV